MINSFGISFKAAYLRITLNKITLAFFLFSFLHCFAQGLIQSFIFALDAETSTLTSGILKVAQVDIKSQISWLQHWGTDYNLQMCHNIPRKSMPDACEPLFDTKVNVNTSVLTSRSFMTLESMSSIRVSATNDPDTGESGGVTLTRDQVSGDDSQNSIYLNPTCTKMVMYPDQVMKNHKREAISLIILQFWLFSMSYMAVMYDSVPHTLTVLVARVLATAWSAYALWRSDHIQKKYDNLFNLPGTPCSIDFFPGYTTRKMAFDIADLVLNLTALFISVALSTNLLKMYSAQVFKRVGPPKHIVRIYRSFLAVLVALQLSAFFITTSTALWIDVLVNSGFISISSHTPIYRALFIFTIIVILPWIATGWYAIRLEKRLFMSVYLSIGFCFLGGWSAMFDSLVYRWIFVQWPFFATMVVYSFITFLASLIFGVMSWLGFNKGLNQYLTAEELLEKSDFEHEVFPHKADDPEVGMEKAEPWEELDIDGKENSTTSYYIPTLLGGASDEDIQRGVVGVRLPGGKR